MNVAIFSVGASVECVTNLYIYTIRVCVCVCVCAKMLRLWNDKLHNIAKPVFQKASSQKMSSRVVALDRHALRDVAPSRAVGLNKPKAYQGHHSEAS